MDISEVRKGEGHAEGIALLPPHLQTFSIACKRIVIVAQPRRHDAKVVQRSGDPVAIGEFAP
jgi:hypothetical protein